MNGGLNNNYEDIINLPHHVSKKHPQMSMEERAAQFAPFAALIGYGEAVKETARLTDKRIELDEEKKEILNEKMQMIKSEIKNMPMVSFTYFIPDTKKDGGKYFEITGRVVKVDEYNKKVILEEGEEIPINDIIEINFATK